MSQSHLHSQDPNGHASGAEPSPWKRRLPGAARAASTFLVVFRAMRRRHAAVTAVELSDMTHCYVAMLVVISVMT